jgi:hypothetical protein
MIRAARCAVRKLLVRFTASVAAHAFSVTVRKGRTGVEETRGDGDNVCSKSATVSGRSATHNRHSSVTHWQELPVVL